MITTWKKQPISTITIGSPHLFIINFICLCITTDFLARELSSPGENCHFEKWSLWLYTSLKSLPKLQVFSQTRISNPANGCLVMFPPILQRLWGWSWQPRLGRHFPYSRREEVRKLCSTQRNPLSVETVHGSWPPHGGEYFRPKPEEGLSYKHFALGAPGSPFSPFLCTASIYFYYALKHLCTYW